MKVRHRAFATLAGGLILCLGCTRSDSIQGTVTYNKKPVQEGSISFRPVDGETPGFGAKIVDGRFTATKVWPGEHVALVRGLNKKVAPKSTAEAIQQYEEAKAAGEKTLDHFGQPTDYIPENAEGNGKTIEIQPGSNTLDFALEGPPRPE